MAALGVVVDCGLGEVGAGQSTESFDDPGVKVNAKAVAKVGARAMQSITLPKTT
jgi:hypothetical protein